MSRITLALASSLCLAGLLGCESAVLVNNDPGTDSSTPNLNDKSGSTADTATYRESAATDGNADNGRMDSSANVRGGATTRPAMQVETKNVTIEKQRDND